MRVRWSVMGPSMAMQRGPRCNPDCAWMIIFQDTMFVPWKVIIQALSEESAEADMDHYLVDTCDLCLTF